MLKKHPVLMILSLLLGALVLAFVVTGILIMTFSSGSGEFDYLLEFEDGKPDAFVYCITDEGCHLTYHRFTREDYEAFGF